MPVQGERWIIPGTGRGVAKLSFPTADIMMQNFPKWFPELDGATSALVARLYGGGEYTESRVVPHSLFHYKSFERLLIARCGTSIKQKRHMEAIVQQGGATLAEQSAAVVALIAEANALKSQLKSCTKYQVPIDQCGHPDSASPPP